MVTEKTCSDCKVMKCLNDFSSKKRGLYGRDSICKKCYRIRAKKRREKNGKRKDIKIPTEKHCTKCDETKPSKAWSRDKGRSDGLAACCKECHEKIRAKYRSCPEVQERERKYRRKYYSNPKIRMRTNEWKRRYKKVNPTFKLSELERARVWHVLTRSHASTNLRQDERLGCSVAYFRKWIESQFEEGMTWENHGEVWHVDHIKPLSWFDLTDEGQQKEAFHYTNQQPLFAEENWSKSDKFIG